jgi:hypothetical protein
MHSFNKIATRFSSGCENTISYTISCCQRKISTLTNTFRNASRIVMLPSLTTREHQFTTLRVLSSFQASEEFLLNIVLTWQYPLDSLAKTNRWFSARSCFVSPFSLLFPFCVLPEIPGEILRTKAQTLLQSDVGLRSSRLACLLMLFLFDAVTDKEIEYSQRLQWLQAPAEISRRVASYPSATDPSFDKYWRRE